ncbi:hypothetical protein HZU77_014100 [Neisseriaceae bacterium TC5R-5]|nr:hypothetical protein [Neisseriaceae bacterium TC5R-5]
MKLIIKFTPTLTSLAPALQIRGSEEWERSGMAEAAFHLIDNQDDCFRLREAASAGRELKINDVELSIMKLHSNDGQMQYCDHLTINKVTNNNDVVIQVSDEKEAHQKCKDLSVIKDSDGNIRMIHGVTYQIASKRSRWFGSHIKHCGKNNPFTADAISLSVPIVATFKSSMILGILID